MLKVPMLRALIEKVADEKKGIIQVAVASDGSTDRQGEKIAPEGLDISNFLRNPVLLFAHDYRAEPVGKVLEMKLVEGRWLFSAQMAIDISEKAKRVFDLMKGGYLNAFSIGFAPSAYEDERQADGSFVRKWTRAELLEISVVPVPANANALVLARSKGLEVEYEGLHLIQEPKKKEAPAAPEFATKTELAAIQTTVDQLNGTLKEIQTQVGDIAKGLAGPKPEDKKVEEPTKAAQAVTLKDVLVAIDQAVGVALRDLKPKK